MDVFDRYASGLEDEKQAEFNKFKAAALQYTEDGLSEDMVAELLQIDGCSVENSHKLASASTDSLPDDYLHGQPPKTFDDVANKVDHSVRSASLKDLEVYFEKYAPKKYSGVIEDIKTARATGLPSHYKEVVAQIRPLVDSLIIKHRTNVQMGRVASSGVKEAYEQGLWGVWAPELIAKFAQKENSEAQVLKKAEKREIRFNL